ncbi:MAG TPA: hypothetical protein VHY09_12325 [Candidatus Methylacidiphilales bacterium]|nr:hypothetical protein [Candidatus Methylacidiphilales bacterium]
MPSLKIVAAVCFLVSGLGVCRANLGDTEAQCVARYGSESDVQDGLGYHQVGDKVASFHTKAWGAAVLIRITFLNGRVCHEMISNDDSSRGLTVDQMKAILNAEGAGMDWHKGRTVFRTDRSSWDTAGVQDWQRGDGATAKFWMSGKAASQSENGEVELATKQYTTAQAFYDKEDGAN